MTNYVAIDIGGTNIKYGLIDQEGQLVESHEMPTEAHKWISYLTKDKRYRSQLFRKKAQ